ncbi:hypothetical protein MMC25_007885 [Agyrium rufum]|nr:hypothetical protein [Agyrium rufum]
MSSNPLITSFIGAVSASISVLLTIVYGVIAAQFELLDGDSAKAISKVCVKLFLPALLISNVGNELHLDTATRYVPILIWAISYALLSFAIGAVTTRMFKLPRWVTPAIAINNTTSLPLLLIQSLDATGILNRLLASEDDTTSAAIMRAKSYFLVCAMVSNSLAFAVGPRLLQEGYEPDEDDSADGGNDVVKINGQVSIQGDDPESQQSEEQEHNAEESTEQTSLLPEMVITRGKRAGDKASSVGNKYFAKLPRSVQATLSFLYEFLNAPLIGAVIGAIIGLTPSLHKAFFSSQEEGGIFNAWLTSSITNIGELFAALQVVVVGVKLSSSLRKMKRGEQGGSVPWAPMLFVLVLRFVVWPAVSIGIIYALATKTSLLSDDPILWFTMMLMPTGPTAISLTALTDVSGVEDEEKLSVAKFLTVRMLPFRVSVQSLTNIQITYAISPLICFAVVGSLSASEKAMQVT